MTKGEAVRRASAMAAAALSVMVAGAAITDDAPAPDKSGFTVFNPTPTSDLRPLCADRPSKATGPCTVDAGHWQVESDLYNVTFQSAGGVSTRIELFTNPTLKLGLTNSLDVEVSMSPWQRVTTRDGTSGATTTASGIGDLYLRAKWNLAGDDGGQVAFALDPYLKLPTAPTTVGNGEVEAGLAAPLQISLPEGWQLSLGPEADVLANAVGSGRHLNASGVVSVSCPITPELTGAAEVWGDEDFEPTGRVTQASADLALAWIPTKAPSVQLDGGINFGLNRATPRSQLYVGVTRRF